MKYIYSDDIAFVGKSTKVYASRRFDNMIMSENYAAEYAEGNFFDVVTFELTDTGGVLLTVPFHYKHRFDDFQNTSKMPETDDFRTQPNYEPTGFYNYQTFEYEGVQYHYTNGVLSTIRWYHKDYTVGIYLERDTNNEPVIYPKGKDTYVNRLLDPETTHQAVQEMNDVVEWVFYTRPAVLRVASYAGCAAFLVGVVFFLIVRRRRKKTSLAAETTEEVKE